MDKIKVGDIVMFRKKCQRTPYPMKTTAIRYRTIAETKIKEFKVDYLWWPESSLMLYEEWEKIYKNT